MGERAWTMILKPGSDMTADCLEQNKIVIGWGVGAETSEYYDLRQAIQNTYYPQNTDFLAAGQAAGMVYSFCQDMRQGDYVIVPSYNYQFYLARITGSKYSYGDDGIYEYAVEWLHKKQALSWKSAPANLSRACRSRRSLKNCDYALPEIREIATNREFLSHSWETELYETIVETVGTYLLNGRINPTTFQTEVLPKVLKAVGASQSLNRAGTSDKGIDIHVTFPVAGNLASKQLGIQTKYWNPNPPVGNHVIDETIEGAKAENLDTAWVVTTGAFSPEVEEYAQKRILETGIEISLIDGRALSQLVLECLDKEFISQA